MPSDAGATTSELFVVICPSERHDPPGPWTYPPGGTSYAEARRIELRHGMDLGLGHEDTRIEAIDPESPPVPPAPPTPPAPSWHEEQVGIQPQYDLTSKTFTAAATFTFVLKDMTWAESRDHLLRLFDEPGLNVQVDTTGQVQLVLQVDVIKRSLHDLCESCHSALLNAAEAHLQLQEGVATSGGHVSHLENAAVFLSTQRGDWEYQLGAQIQSLDGKTHGQLFGSLVFHFGGK